ncbi:MAG: DUF3138 family protein [Rubrivivax sp.]|jgi:hypothetical protein|nr:DUF3138 family protein [Rubrivivax sp.]
MSTFRPGRPAPQFARPLLALAAAAALLPAHAQQAAPSLDDLLKEIRTLRDRVAELEKKAATPAAAPAPQPGQWGMTPEQAREFNRIAVKTESLQDNFTDQGYKGLKISGQIDPTWIFNRNNDNAGFVFLNNGGARYTYDNSYFGMAVLDLEKETDNGVKWRLTLAPERGTGALINNSIVHEATVSIPLSDLNTRLWVGQIPDWTGYEITLPAGNKLITHNLLFDFTAPTAYTGAVLDITRGKWWIRAGIANMNSARYAPGNKQPVAIARVDYSKGEFGGFGFTALHGKAYNFAADGTYSADSGQVDANGDPIFVDTPFATAGKNTGLTLLEADAYFIRGDLSVFGQVSFGQQNDAAIFNSDGQLRDSRWYGISGLVGYKLSPRTEALLRVDYIRNGRNGGGLLGYTADDTVNGIGRGINRLGEYARGPGVGAHRWAISTGVNYLFDENTTFKFEVRYDGSNQPVFGKVRTGETRNNNLLIGSSVVVSF